MPYASATYAAKPDNMEHWLRVNVILQAAGSPEALFGEIRHHRDVEPIEAAFRIWNGRRA